MSSTSNITAPSTTVETLSYSVLLPLAIVIWIILSFCQKRTKSFLGVLHDRPGVVHPINFLNPKHRLVYSLVCAALGSLWLNLIQNSFLIGGHSNKWVSVFVSAIILILLVLMQVIVSYPMLACVEAPIPIVGYALGLIYSFVYFIARLAVFISALRDSSVNAVKPLSYVYNVFSMMPQLICISVVIIWYAYKLLRKCAWIMDAKDRKQAVFQQFPSSNNSNYVRNLFKQQQQSRVSSLSLISLYNKIHLPLPVLLATAIFIVVMIQLTVIFSVLLLPIINYVFGFNANDTINHIRGFLRALVIISSLLASGFSTVLFGHLLFTIRREILLIRRGQSELCERIHKVPSPIAFKLASYAGFTGTQVAAFITGWLFYYVVFVIIVGFLGMIYFLPDIFGYLLYLFFVVTILSLSIWGVQALMCHFLFLTQESSSNSTVVLDNRRVFNFFTYTILLYNIAKGLFGSLIRLLLGLGLMLLVLPRLDRLLYVKPFRILDKGYSSYRNFMIIEGLITNPVMHAFVDIMLSFRRQKNPDSCKTLKYQSTETIITQDKHVSGCRFSLKAKNRWFKAYTLIKNPCLQRHSPYSACNIAAIVKDDDPVDTSTTKQFPTV